MSYTIIGHFLKLHFSKTISTNVKKYFSKDIDVVPKLDYKQNLTLKYSRKKKQIIISYAK
jgi:hypothetical protein